MQVGSRIWVLWGVVNLASRATTTQSLELFHVGQHAVQLNFMTLVVAWSLSEVVRYSFFAVKARPIVIALPYAMCHVATLHLTLHVCRAGGQSQWCPSTP